VDHAVPSRPTSTFASLNELRDTPLHRMRREGAEAVDVVVRRVLPEELPIASVEVTAFNSSI
jgi:hypothetical protein